MLLKTLNQSEAFGYVICLNEEGYMNQILTDPGLR